jgi:hypothetical protein
VATPNNDRPIFFIFDSCFDYGDGPLIVGARTEAVTILPATHATYCVIERMSKALRLFFRRVGVV